MITNGTKLCVCPESGHVFQGVGWDGIDAHWKAKHGRVMPYDEAWPLIKSGVYEKAAATPKRTADEQRAEIERVAREHGADLSEEGFTEALRKVARRYDG